MPQSQAYAVGVATTRDEWMNQRIEVDRLPSQGRKTPERGDQMTSYGGKELASAFRTVRKNTLQVAEDIPESKYGFVAAPEVRSVGRMLTHIAIATRTSEEVHKKRLTTLVGFD